MSRWTTVGEAFAYEKGYIEGRADSSQWQWIPCTPETMPQEDGEYLVTKKSFRWIGWNYTEYEETDIARYEKKDGWHKADMVLAWCELPEPWEEKQK